MRFSTVAAAAAFVAGTNAWSNHTGPAYVTEVVTAYTTYCPGPTKITHGHKTYTVTKATTLTISDCPCTVTKPVSTAVVTSCTTSTPVAPVYTPPVVKPSPPAPYVPSVAPPAPYKNETTTVVPAPPAGTGAPTTSAPPKFTGAANKAFAASGAGLAAVFGVAAYIL
jgi:hypothetical protein